MKYYPLGFDVSRWNGNIDIAVMMSYAKFIWIKSVEGWSGTDLEFLSTWHKFQGFNRGSYSYIHPDLSAQRQAEHFLKTVKEGGVDWRYDRLALDLEKPDHGMTKTQVTNMVLEMMERLAEVTGRYPVLYSRASWVESNLILADPRLLQADWWLATYLQANPYPEFTEEKAPPPILPKGLTRWAFHQSGEKNPGRKYGAGSHYIDSNRFNGSDAELEAYFGRQEPPTGHELVVEEPLYPAIVINEAGLSARQGAGNHYPKARFVQYKTVVGVYAKADGWLNIGRNQWIIEHWTQRVGSIPLEAKPDNLLKVQLWSQKDPRWANDRMGTSGVKMAEQGCLVTDVAAYLHFLGVDTDPKRLNQLLNQKGGYQPPHNMYWKMPGNLYPAEIAEELTDYPTAWYANGKGWETKTLNILATGRPVLGMVDLVAGDAIDQHWVLIVGEHNGHWWASDPEYGTLVKLDQYQNKIYRIAAYRRK